MQTLPLEGSSIILHFRRLFSKNVFDHAVVLLLGALLLVGRRTVCAALRIMGLAGEKRFHKYHRVLSEARWSLLQGARILLELLVGSLCGADAPLVFALDETLERRRGDHIAAKGVYYDAVRSSRHQKVKSTGLRWVCMMLLTRIPWAHRVWALPFLTVLAPSGRYFEQRGKTPKKITDWARQMILQVAHWLKGRTLVVVADSAYSTLELLGAVRDRVTFITRLRLDAALYAEPRPRPPGRSGRPPAKGERLPSLGQVLVDPATEWQPLVVPQWYDQKDVQVEVSSGVALWYHKGHQPLPIRWVLLRDPENKKDPAALLSTDVSLSAEAILNYFICRWTVEVTFEEVRARLGVESQRQWSDPAIGRTTPALLALFSITTLWADSLNQTAPLQVAQAAWYEKTLPTFSDALSAVRSQIWEHRDWGTSDPPEDMLQIPRHQLKDLMAILTRAA